MRRLSAAPELRHYIVARALGFRVGDVYLKMKFPSDHGGGCATTLSMDLSNLDDVKDYLDWRVQVLFAGSLAQSLTPSGVVDEDKANGFLNINARNDYSKARELIHVLRSITYPLSNDLLEVQAQLTRVYDDSWKKAIRAVQRDYKLIKGL